MTESLQYILIDDSEFDLFLNKEFLHLAGITGKIHSFDSAADALNFLLKEGDEIEPSVLLLDIHMPVMNGFEFLEKYNIFPESLKARIKLFMVSSTLDESDIEQARNSRYVIDILSKPLDAEELKRKVESH